MKKAHPKSLAEAQRIVNRIDHMEIDDSMVQGGARRFDEDATNMLALQLEQMRSRVYETEFAARKARTIIPVTNEVDPGAETFAFETSTEAGKAEIITNYAADLRSVETKAGKEVYGVVGLGDSFNYSIQDLYRAAFAGKQLSGRKAIAARRAWERGLDDIAATGAPAQMIKSGFTNDTDVTVTTLAAAGVWSGKTPAQIMADLNKFTKSVIIDSKELYTGSDLVLPLEQYMLLTHTDLSDSKEGTLLEHFMKKNPWIKTVTPWNVLAGAGSGDSDRAVIFERDPEVLELVIPLEFTVMAPQQRNLAFTVLCHGRTAGCCIYKHLGIRYMDGI